MIRIEGRWEIIEKSRRLISSRPKLIGKRPTRIRIHQLRSAGEWNDGSKVGCQPFTAPPWMEPPATSAASAATTAATIAPSGADLVLDDVKLVAPATLVAGPAYTVKFRNQARPCRQVPGGTSSRPRWQTR